MRTVTKYESEDHKVHDTETQCKQHEKQCRLQEFVRVLRELNTSTGQHYHLGHVEEMFTKHKVLISKVLEEAGK